MNRRASSQRSLSSLPFRKLPTREPSPTRCVLEFKDALVGSRRNGKLGELRREVLSKTAFPVRARAITVTLPMKRRSGNQAITLVELLVVIALLALLMMMVLPRVARPRRGAALKCMNNLKNVGLAFRIFATDNNGRFPTAVSASEGGTLEQLNTPSSAFHHFAAMSNELSTPKILVCPQDGRNAATNWISLRNINLSYFVGLKANPARPKMFLSGDRHIASDIHSTNGFLELKPNLSVRWSRPLHENRGHIVFADGSVHALFSPQLARASRVTGDATNRVALP